MDKHGKKKKMLVACIMAGAVFVHLHCTAIAAEENEIADIIEIQAGQAADEIGEQVEKYAKDGWEEILGSKDPARLIRDIALGNSKAELKSLWARIGNYFIGEVRDNIQILLKVMVIIIICAVLNNLRSAFLSESAGEMAFFVCYTALVAVLAAGFKEASMLGTRMVDDMVSFMYATSPVLISLMASGGNITTAATIQPVVVLVVETAATIMKNVFIPLILITTVVGIIDNISERIKITKVAAFLRRVCLWGTGIVLTAFGAVVSVYGALGAVTDGIAGKTVKFAIGSVPVVGSYLSDAADTVMGCALIVKNAAGLVAVLGVFGICALPLLKIGALVLVYKAAGIIAEPVSDKRISKVFDEVGNSLVYIFAVSAAVAVMFVITITAIIGASNISAMIR